MKIFSYIMLIALVSNFCCKTQKKANCQILPALLKVEKLKVDLKLNPKSTGYIRILDKSGRFKNCECGFENYHIIVDEDIPLDFNTGRFIDLAITSFKQKENTIKIEIFYALSGQNDATPNLFIGSINITKSDDGFKIKDYNIGNFS